MMHILQLVQVNRERTPTAYTCIWEDYLYPSLAVTPEEQKRQNARVDDDVVIVQDRQGP